MSLPSSGHGLARELIDTGIRILGPLELVGAGRLWKIGGPRDQVVLAMLAMRAHTVVSVGQLIDGIWGDAPPPSARGQVQTSISTLRKLLGDAGIPHAIRTRPSGYVLDVSDEHLDSARFNALVATANRHAAVDDLEVAAETLNRALGLWRGPALDGLQSDLVRNTAAVLEEARLTVAEERLRLELDLAHHDAIVGELRALLAEHPWRERLYGFLMIALYRTGRQAEALEVYRQARAVLIADVGIEPGQELRDLERAVLSRDPSLDARPAAPVSVPEPRSAEPVDDELVAAPRQLPATVADFVGREELITDIVRLMTDRAAASRHAMPVVALTGRGGAGKSALALRVAHELRDTFPDGHMYLDLREPDGDKSTPALLERFLRALGVPGRLIPGKLGERLEMYRSRLADKRMLLVLDDAVSEEQVLPLFPGSASCGVIVTSRGRLGGLPGAHRLDVGALGDEAAIELLARMVGPDRLAEDRDAAAAVVRYCGRLPLALRIAGARLASRPHRRIGWLARLLADEGRRLDELSYRDLTMRACIESAHRELSAADQHVFRWLALTEGPSFPGWVAAALSGTDLGDAEATIDRLVEAHLLDLRGDRYALPELVRLYAKECLDEIESTEAKRSAVERVLGAWLARTELACRKQFGAGRLVLRGRATRVTLPEWADDDSPLGWLDRERAALVTAVRQAAGLDLDELCWELALAAGRLFEASGHVDDWREIAELAHETAVRAGNQAGRAASLCSLGSLYLHRRQFAAAGRRFDEAAELFAAVGDPVGQAVVRCAAAVVDRWLGRLGSRRADYEAALATVRAAGDVVGQVRILVAIAGFLLDEGVVGEVGPVLDEALALCEADEHQRLRAEVLIALGELHLRTHQASRARRTLTEVLLAVREAADEAGEARILYLLGLVRRTEGELDSAAATLAHVLALGERIGDRLVVAQAHYTLGDMAVVRADYAAAAASLDRARVAFRELGLVLWLARTHVLLAEARAAVGATAAATANLSLARELSVAVECRQSTRLRRRIDAARSAQGGDAAGD